MPMDQTVLLPMLGVIPCK